MNVGAGVQPGALEDPVDAVLRAVHGQPHQVRVGPRDCLDDRAVGGIVSRGEHVVRVDGERETTPHRALPSGAQRVRGRLEGQHRHTEDGEVGLPVGVDIVLSHELGAGRGDARGEQGGDVEPLPGGKVVAHGDGDPGGERRREQFVGHASRV